MTVPVNDHIIYNSASWIDVLAQVSEELLAWKEMELRWIDESMSYSLVYTLIAAVLLFFFMIIVMRLTNMHKHIIRNVCIMYVACVVLAIAAQLIPVPGTAAALLFMFAFGIIIILVILYRFSFGSLQSTSAGADRILIEQAVKKVFTSEHFLTTLGSSIPGSARGDDDDGMKDIPHLLRAIHDIKSRNQKDERRFLAMTIGFGIVSAASVLFFTWTLIDDTFAGLPQRLQMIQSSVQMLARIYDTTSDAYWDSVPYDYIIEKAVVPLRSLSPSEKKASLKTEIDHDIDLNRHNVDDMKRVITGAMKKFGPPTNPWIDNSDTRYYNQLQTSLSFLDKYVTEQIVTHKVRAEIDSIRQNLEQIVNRKDLQVNPVVELIKRIALGFIACTFLLALLKFFARTYLKYHDERRKFEDADINVRKFRIAFKRAKVQPDTAALLIKQFVGDNSVTNVVNSDAEKIQDTESIVDTAEKILKIVEAATKRS